MKTVSNMFTVTRRTPDFDQPPGQQAALAEGVPAVGVAKVRALAVEVEGVAARGSTARVAPGGPGVARRVSALVEEPPRPVQGLPGIESGRGRVGREMKRVVGCAQPAGRLAVRNPDARVPDRTGEHVRRAAAVPGAEPLASHRADVRMLLVVAGKAVPSGAAGGPSRGSARRRGRANGSR